MRIFDEVVAHYKSKSKLARALGVTPQAINYQKDGRMPEAWVLKLHILRGNPFTKAQINAALKEEAAERAAKGD